MVLPQRYAPKYFGYGDFGYDSGFGYDLVTKCRLLLRFCYATTDLVTIWLRADLVTICFRFGYDLD